MSTMIKLLVILLSLLPKIAFSDNTFEKAFKWHSVKVMKLKNLSIF